MICDSVGHELLGVAQLKQLEAREPHFTDSLWRGRGSPRSHMGPQVVAGRNVRSPSGVTHLRWQLARATCLR